MSEWICPINSLDPDIREITALLYSNNMRPFTSCSGSYKDHKNNSYFSESAFISILDSEATRELIAKLINDRRFKCSISKEKGCLFYGNNIPTGLRFSISFDNVEGDMQTELQSTIESVIHREKADTEDRRKVDLVCNTLDEFKVPDNRVMEFSFNNQHVVKGEEASDNYSITIRDRRRFERYAPTVMSIVDDFSQDQYSSTFFGKDFSAMVSTIKRIINDYDNIPRLGNIENPVLVSPSAKRYNKFLKDYDEKRERAQAKIEQADAAKGFESEFFNFEDLINAFPEATGDLKDPSADSGDQEL